MRARFVDVSALPAPEPLQVVLDALGELAPGEYLVLAHRREPFPLYELLAGRGFRHRVRRGSRTPFEILVWRAGSPPPAEA